MESVLRFDRALVVRSPFPPPRPPSELRLKPDFSGISFREREGRTTCRFTRRFSHLALSSLRHFALNPQTREWTHGRRILSQKGVRQIVARHGGHFRGGYQRCQI